MKKIGFYILALAATLFASCEGDYDDWAAPQGFEEEAPEEVTLGVTSIGAINMVDVTAETIQLFTPDLNVPEGYSLEGYTAVIDKEYELPVTISGQANVNDIKAIVETIYGKAPYERELSLAVTAHLKKGEKAFIKSVGEQIVKVTLVAPYISKHYYVIGAPSEWDPSCTTLPFSHSGKDVYDDPIFTVTFPVSAGDTWFAITDDMTVAAGDDWKQVLGCAEGNGKNGAEGKIARRTELQDDGSWMIHVDTESNVKMTIDMMNYTYKIEIIPMSSFYYVVGGVQGWSDSKRSHLFFPTDAAKEFSYTTKWTGAWDLKVWSKNDFGNWDNAIGCAVDGCADATGELIFSGAQAISAPSAEYYTFTINMATNTYTWTKLANQSPATYDAISLIGDFNGWGGDIDLEKVCDNNWYVEAEIPSNGGLKFRANHDWGTNWGAVLDLNTQNFAQGVANGDNIYVPAGKYRFYLNDITGKLAIVPVN